ncbi:MAG: GTP 3',8-cyclase MoaA [Lachnospiraceae bacterium]|nr:GTP 3',8-cyclase MoaA [Lachnospiraceae bacterium]
MKDGYGRTIDYLRISVTDRCNLRCRYCMPNGIVSVPMKEILSIEEIVFTVQVLAELGLKKIKITGGEPLVRRGCVTLIRMLKSIPGIEDVTLTTNGVLLEEMLPDLIDAGIRSVNISIDTIDREKYRMITGQDQLDKVLSSVKAALDQGLFVKINAVSVDWSFLNNTHNTFDNDRPVPVTPKEIFDLIEYARDRNLCVRFIEMMPIGYGTEYPNIPHSLLIPDIMRKYSGMKADDKKYGNGPAVYYNIPGFTGSIGFISAINDKFCSSCNRIRLTTNGYLKSCLCYDQGVALMDIIRGGYSQNDKRKLLKKVIKETITDKPEMHCFEDKSNISESHAMSYIGG